MKNLSRGLTDEGWRELDPAHIATWKEMQETQWEKSYKTTAGPLTIRADFNGPIQRLGHHYDVMSRIYEDPAKPDPAPMSEFKHEAVKYSGSERSFRSFQNSVRFSRSQS